MTGKRSVSRRETVAALGTTLGLGLVGGAVLSARRPSPGPKASDAATNRSTEREPPGPEAAAAPAPEAETAHAVSVERTADDPRLRGTRTRCLASLEGEAGAVAPGEQLRIGGASDESENKTRDGCALYTVIDTARSPRTIEMGSDALERLDLTHREDGIARRYAPHPTYETRAAAKANDEYVEILRDDGREADLVACAVHGGRIEWRTDQQAAYVADALEATEWSCVGYNSGGGAYDRWHVTSTDIDRRSFPGLDRIADRGFAHAVSFHGLSNDGIAVGGGAAESFKRRVRDAIVDATDGRYDVSIVTSGEYAGNSPDNFVNWLAANGNGVQLEQSWDARDDDWQPIAEAIIEVYRDALDGR